MALSRHVTGIKSGLYNCVWSAWEAQQNYQWLSVKRTCEKKPIPPCDVGGAIRVARDDGKIFSTTLDPK